MALTDEQINAAIAIVNIFETGKVQGDCGRVTVLPGDPGHLTYGQSQTTLASGNLHHLIKAYCDHPDSGLSAELQPYLSRIACRDFSLDDDSKFRQLLKKGGNDPVMRAVQHTFFRKSFWDPAAAAARKANITTALGTAVVYDSF